MTGVKSLGAATLEDVRDGFVGSSVTVDGGGVRRSHQFVVGRLTSHLAEVLIGAPEAFT